MADDLFAEFIRRVLEADDRGGKQEVTRTEIRIREQYGGQRIYLQKDPSTKKTMAAGASLAAGRNLNEAFAAAGVSRATGYRLLARRWRR